MIRTQLLPEQTVDPNHRLGRHIQFDERSRGFSVQKLCHTDPIRDCVWVRKKHAFNQGNTGSCTGNAVVGLLVTEPFVPWFSLVSEVTAMSIYRQATTLDDIPGAYPPEDTGSTILAAMKALVRQGRAKSYHWCFGLDDTLRTLSNVGPVAVGVNWYESFDFPDAITDQIRLSGSVRGGHAVELLGVDTHTKMVIGINSWGPSWGREGQFALSWGDLDRLLHENGEAATIIKS